MVMVPAVMIKSACRGLERGTRPKRSKSKREPMRAANSMKQQAVPYNRGHKLDNLAQLCKSSTVVKIIFSDKS